MLITEISQMLLIMQIFEALNYLEHISCFTAVLMFIECRYWVCKDDRDVKSTRSYREQLSIPSPHLPVHNGSRLESRISDTILLPQWAPGLYTVHSYTHGRNTHTHKIKQNETKQDKNKYLLYLRVLSCMQ